MPQAKKLRDYWKVRGAVQRKLKISSEQAGDLFKKDRELAKRVAAGDVHATDEARRLLGVIMTRLNDDPPETSPPTPATLPTPDMIYTAQFLELIMSTGDPEKARRCFEKAFELLDHAAKFLEKRADRG